MITTIVTFYCDAFNTVVTNEFNEGIRYSDDMALWISVELGSSGYELVDEITHNDTGSNLTFKCENHLYDFTIRYIDGCEWVGYLARHMGLLPSIIGLHEHGLNIEAARVVHDILSSDKRISNTKWFYRDIYETGDLTTAYPEPQKAS